MSIDTINDLPPRVQYEAAAAQTVFPYPFPIFQNADLVVDIDGSIKTLTTDYTVSGAGDDTGGNVTLVAALLGGEIVTIYRQTVIERDSDFQLNGPMFSTNVNDEFDKLTVIAQEIRALLKRCIRIPVSAEVDDAAIELAPISNWYNKTLVFDAAGKPEPGELVTGIITQSIIGALFQPQTPAESAAAVVPVNYFMPEGHVERYATWVSSATDFTTAFQRVAAVARNKPGLVVQFTAGRTYATTAVGGATIFDLQGARGVFVYGNGATISAGNVNAGILDVFDLNDVQDVQIVGLRYTQTYLTLDSANGARFFRVRGSSSRITLMDCYQLGGNCGLACIADLATGVGRSDQITALNCHFENVYYPQSFQGSGDQYFARGIKTIKCGRGYFPYNCRQHDVEMFSQQGGPFDDVLIACYATAGAPYNRTEQIKLRYHSTGKHLSGSNQSAGAAVVAIVATQNSVASTPAEIDSIDVRVIFDAIAAPTSNKLFTIRKFKFDGSPDNTGRSHVFSNIKFGGRVRGWQNANGAACVHWFSTTDGEVWTGDTAFNCSVEDFYATGSAAQSGITINYQPFPADTGIALRNVFTDMQINRVNANEQHSFVAEQVVSAGLICGGYKAYTPTVTGSTSNPTLGNGTVTGRWRRSGDWVEGYAEFNPGSTTSGGVGNLRLSLPTTAAVGEGDQILGGVLLFDSGTRLYTGVPLIQSNQQFVELYADQGAVSFATPFAYANGDKYRVSFRYLSSPS